MSTHNHFIGYKWLANHFNLPFHHYHESKIGRQLKTIHNADGSMLEEYTAQYYPGDLAVKHVVFALKYEGIALSILQGAFKQMDEREIIQFIRDSPSGKYAKQIGFLCELLTGQNLDVGAELAGNYVNVVDPQRYVVPDGVLNAKWRVRDNLPGDAHFCPLVRRTEAINSNLKINLSSQIKQSYANVDPQIFRRAVNYLYFKETRSSNEIEHERPGSKREEAFVELLRNAGKIDMGERLTEAGLAACQSAITDPRFSQDAFRDNQNYVGEGGQYGENPYVHLIGMPPEYVTDVMAGFNTYQEKTSGMNSVVRAASLSFSFVFIHPFDDGNGRVHRFLINDLLAHDGVLEKGVVLPVSAAMVRDPIRYDQALEAFSIPLMRTARYEMDVDHQITVLNPEEIVSFYRFPDLTRQVEYLFSVIDETIRVDMAQEIQIIIAFDALRDNIKAIVDMPNRETELLMKMLHQNNGILSGNKRKRYFDFLSDEEIGELETAYLQAFIKAKEK